MDSPVNIDSFTTTEPLNNIISQGNRYFGSKSDFFVATEIEEHEEESKEVKDGLAEAIGGEVDKEIAVQAAEGGEGEEPRIGWGKSNWMSVGGEL